MTTGLENSLAINLKVTLLLVTVTISILAHVSNSELEHCDADSQECRPSGSGWSTTKFAQLHSGGLSSDVKLTDLSNFPNYKLIGKTFDIIRRVAGTFDYKAFGTLLLNDEDGSEMGILENDNLGAVEMMTQVFTNWIQGKVGPASSNPRDWATLVKHLQEKDLNTIADDIEGFFSLGDSKSQSSQLPSLKVPNLWKDIEKFEAVYELLQKVYIALDDIKISHIGMAKEKMEPLSQDINRVLARIENGAVRVGIIGLTKAGKSTFLNALLGNEFLPSSFQPQTANETVIIHDMSKLDGELHCTLAGKSKKLAAGPKKIHQELLKLNNEQRKKGETSKTCDKLILYAPLQFLSTTDMEGVKLELSDTPGFGEAGVEKISASINITVKELCAFIWILNSNNLKTVSEMELMIDLMFFHPQLFSDLNRVLILINGRTELYEEKKLSVKSASITPNDVPKYVSEYFASPDFLDIKIDPEKIVLFNALWALRSRKWAKDLEIDSDPKKAVTLYKEAMLMLRYNDKDELADSLEYEKSKENVRKVISELEPFSNIEEVERLLKKMVIENGGHVLLASAIDDTSSVIINSVVPTIRQLIGNEDIHSKQEELESAEQLSKLLEDILIQSLMIFDETELYSSIESHTRAQISTFHDTIQDSLSNIISTRLLNTLQHTNEEEEKSKVVEEMQAVRNSIPSAILTKIKKEWLMVTEAIRTSAVAQLRAAFSNIRLSMLSSLSKLTVQEDDLIFREFVDEFSSTISTILLSVGDSANSMVQDSSSLPINQLSLAGNEAVQDNALSSSYIQVGKKQKINLVSKRKCGGGFLGWGKTCIEYNDAVPYDKPVFSPKIDALKSAFEDSVKSWMDQYDKEVTAYLLKISQLSGATGRKKLENIFTSTKESVAKLLNDRKEIHKRSLKNIAFLELKKEELKSLTSKLRGITREP